MRATGVRAVVAMTVMGLAGACASAGAGAEAPGASAEGEAHEVEGAADDAGGGATAPAPAAVLDAELALLGALYDVLEAHADDPQAAAEAVDAFGAARASELETLRGLRARAAERVEDREATFRAVMERASAVEALAERAKRFARRAPAVVASPEVIAAVERAGFKLAALEADDEPEPEASAAAPPPWPEPEPEPEPLSPEDAARLDAMMEVVDGYYALLERHGGEPKRAAELGLAFIASRRGPVDAFHARRRELEGTDPEAHRALLRAAEPRFRAAMSVAMRVQRTYPELLEEPKVNEALGILGGQ